jgi:hypothetical protein
MCVRCEKNRQVKFFTPNGTVCVTCKRQRARNYARGAHLEITYGITMDEYEQILVAQNGACAICRGKRTTSYDVDHDHRLEKELLADGASPLEARRKSVRGLLCRRCNRRLLPASLDNPDVLQGAIQYLMTPPAESVLSPLLLRVLPPLDS